MPNILLRLSEEESELLERRAKENGLGKSEYMRMCLARVKGFEVVMEKPQEDKPLSRPRKSVAELQALVEKKKSVKAKVCKHYFMNGFCINCGARVI
jgi:hypothetical protein